MRVVLTTFIGLTVLTLMRRCILLLLVMDCYSKYYVVQMDSSSIKPIMWSKMSVRAK